MYFYQADKILARLAAGCARLYTGKMDDIAPAPIAEDGLFARLDALDVAYVLHNHPPAFTVEEARNLRGSISGAHVKNLFLRDKKKNLWLVTVQEDRQIDLKALRQILDTRGNLSFGSADLLMAILGVIPGAVTPFGIINDTNGVVRVVLDKELLAQDPVNAHPLRNDMTIAVAPEGLIRFLEAERHTPIIVDFDKMALSAG